MKCIKNSSRLVLLCVLLIISMIAVRASASDSDYKVYASGVNTSLGTEITIPVMLSENKGIMGFVITLNYDKDVLIPQKVIRGELLATNSVFDNNLGINEGSFKVLWSGSDAVYGDGCIFYITFHVKENVTVASSAIGLSYNRADTFNEKYQDIALNIQDITVNINNSEHIVEPTGTPLTDTNNTSEPTIQPTMQPIMQPTTQPNGQDKTYIDPTAAPKKEEAITPSSNNTSSPSSTASGSSASPLSGNAAQPVITATVVNNINSDSNYILKKIKITSIKRLSKNKVKIQWKKDTENKITGYEIQYSTKKNFQSSKKKNVSNKKNKITLTGIKSKKVYYVRIRSYMKYKTQEGAYKTIYGKWNVKNIKKS